MLNPNTELPPSLQNTLKNISPLEGVPVGTHDEMPYILLKVTDEDAQYISEHDITAEFKPTIINMEQDDNVIAFLFIQVRLAGIDRLIYTLMYDLANPKHYTDAQALLQMKQYTLIIGTATEHKILAFNTEFTGDFNPLDVIANAKKNATEYDLQLFHQVGQFIIMSHPGAKNLWDHFEEMAPLEKHWYARLKMEKEED